MLARCFVADAIASGLREWLVAMRAARICCAMVVAMDFGDAGIDHAVHAGQRADR